VLEREPAAVAVARDELRRRRDDAASALAFELAGRLQAEIDAIDWISSEQKVTSLRVSDVDIYGWYDGVLVHFEVRDGSLCGWQQRRCGRHAVRERIAATPAEWAAFAQRNAELAARLMS